GSGAPPPWRPAPPESRGQHAVETHADCPATLAARPYTRSLPLPAPPPTPARLPPAPKTAPPGYGLLARRRVAWMLNRVTPSRRHRSRSRVARGCQVVKRAAPKVSILSDNGGLGRRKGSGYTPPTRSRAASRPTSVLASANSPRARKAGTSSSATS